jgi:HEPN domain-containing protein
MPDQGRKKTMKKTQRHRIAVLLGIVALAACEETGLDTLDQQLTPEESAEVALLEDEGTRQAALELSETMNDVDAGFGAPSFEPRRLSGQARVRLAAAHAALHSGDRRRALEHAREARRLLARAIVESGGADAVEALIERVEDLAANIDDEDVDVIGDPAALRARLEELALEAREHLENGELVRAAERALLAEQIARHHRRVDVTAERAELAVSLAENAVQLAELLVDAPDTPVRTLGTTDVREHMNRWLVHAHRMLAMAQLALENGHNARAVHFAWHAQWSALRAVILPGGVTDEEISAMVDLAHELLDEAEVAIGADPTELQEHMLARAGRLIARGEELIADGYKRGVAPVWRGAVISRWLIG